MTEFSEAPIPKSKADDVPDVVSALETAAALWAKGDQREGLRWLRRAAEAAEQADNDQRALELARRAADLTGLIGASVSPSPPGTAEPSQAPQPEIAVEPPPRPAPPPQPLPASPARASVPPAAISRPPAPSAAPSAAPPASAARAPSIAPLASATATAPGLSAAPPASPLPAASRAQSAAAALAPSARGQVRVFVKTSARDKALYIVRPLESGKRPPLGTREALLVFPDE
jgi:outer membrane biosynthesis protein TonB